jgi:rRNA maturation protein Nop10
MTDEPMKLIRPCPTCQGKGTLDAPHCQECGQRIEPADTWWETADDTLPCGHPAAALVETIPCPDCGGDGRYPQIVSPAEWQKVQRRKRIAKVILFLALLLPIVALAAAVSDAYPGYVCGSWWYGIIIGMLFVKFV